MTALPSSTPARPSGRNEAVPDQPLVIRRDEDVPVPAIVVKTDLGEHGEVRRDLRSLPGELEEADVCHVVPHEAGDTRSCRDGVRRCDTAEEFDDCGAPAHRIAATQLQFAVLAIGVREPLRARGGPRQPSGYPRIEPNRYDPTVITRSSAPSSCMVTRTATTALAPASGSPSTRNGPTLPRARNITCDDSPCR